MRNAMHDARRLKRRRRTQSATSVEEKGIGLENVHMKM
jgi:hypothetical protein